MFPHAWSLKIPTPLVKWWWPRPAYEAGLEFVLQLVGVPADIDRDRVVQDSVEDGPGSPPQKAALAKLFGVTVAAASEWGRFRPVPRHMRSRIEEYLGHRSTRICSRYPPTNAPRALSARLTISPASRLRFNRPRVRPSLVR